MQKDDLRPLLTTIDVQRGFKDITVYLKSGEARPLHVKAIAWPELAEIHMGDPKLAETAVLHACLPSRPWADTKGSRAPYAWLEWLDMDSFNEVCRMVREFAYGFRTEKKRTEEALQFGRTWLEAIRRLRSSASGSGSEMPSAGADPSSPSSPNASAESKLTTA